MIGSGSIRSSGIPEVDSVNLEVEVAPTQAIVDLDFIKEYLKIPAEVETDNDLLNRFTEIATQAIEKRTRRSIMRKTLKATFIGAQKWKRLPSPPVISITEVKTLDAEGNATVTTDYQAIRNPEDYQLYVPIEYSATYGRVLQGVQVTYVAGYATVDSIPGPLFEAILQLVSEMYSNRDVYAEDATTIGTSKVEHKIRPYVDAFTLI